MSWRSAGLRPLVALVLLASLEGLPGRVAQAQTPASVRQGYALLERGWVDDAIATFQSALRRYPNSPEARLGLAIAYQRTGRDTDAWAAYQAVLAVDDDNSTALTAIGEMGSYRPEWQATGIAALTQLLGQNPDNSTARQRRALLYGYQGRFTPALEDYALLLAAEPSPQVLLEAAQVYAFSGDFDGALALFNRYRQTGPYPDAVLPIYALTLQQTGSPQAAVSLLQPLLRGPDRVDDFSLQIRTALANATDASGDSPTALELLAPLQGKPAARLSLARAYSAIGRRRLDPSLFGEAVQLYQAALADTAAPSYGLRVEVADVLSEWPDTQATALTLFRQLAEENPEVVSLAVRSHLLAYDLGQESPTSTAEQLQTLLTPFPQSAPEQRVIATALARIDNPDAPLLPVYKTVAATVDAPLLYHRMAQIHLTRGELLLARQALSAYRSTPVGREDIGAELLIADIERQEGRLAASAERYEAIIASAPPPQVMADALRGLTFVRRLEGQPEAALPIYEQVIADNPQNLNYRLGYSLLGYRTGFVAEDQAAEVLDGWLAAYDLPNPPPELFELTGALPADPARAELYASLLQQKPGDIWLQWRSIQLLAEREPDLAMARLDALIDENPDNLTLYFFQGELAQQQGNLPLATATYERILTQEPENVGALGGLAGVKFQQQEFGAARGLYEQVLVLDPDHGEARYALAELDVAEDYRLTALDQFQQLHTEGVDKPQIPRRVQDVEFDLLRRRGFQPPWERF
jgi:tetratricopeptide (TPR) repeat protein